MQTGVRGASEAAVAVVDDRVFEFGGREGALNALHRQVNLVTDTTSESQTRLADLPFADAIHVTAAVVDTNSIAVAAVICENPRRASGDLSCAGTAVRTATYDIAEDRWTDGDLLPVDVSTGPTLPDPVFPVVRASRASDDGRVHLRYVDVDQSRSFVFSAPPELPLRWTLVRDVPSDAQACADGGDRVFAMTQTNRSTEPVVVGGDPPPTMKVEVAVPGQPWAPAADQLTAETSDVPLLACGAQGAVVAMETSDGRVALDHIGAMDGRVFVDALGTPDGVLMTGDGVIVVDRAGEVALLGTDGSARRARLPAATAAGVLAYDPGSDILAGVRDITGRPNYVQMSPAT